MQCWEVNNSLDTLWIRTGSRPGDQVPQQSSGLSTDKGLVGSEAESRDNRHVQKRFQGSHVFLDPFACVGVLPL